jgi:hypothetical protein
MFLSGEDLEQIEEGFMIPEVDGGEDAQPLSSKD